MTVSDPVAGQQQGREPWVQQVRHAWGQEAQRSGDDGDWRKLSSGILLNIAADHPAPSPTPPARDSGQDEALAGVLRKLLTDDRAHVYHDGGLLIVDSGADLTEPEQDAIRQLLDGTR